MYVVIRKFKGMRTTDEAARRVVDGAPSCCVSSIRPNTGHIRSSALGGHPRKSCNTRMFQNGASQSERNESLSEQH